MFIKSKRSSGEQSRMKLYKPGHVLKVMSDGELLGSRQHQALLQQVFDMSQLDRAEFTLLYDPVITSFVEFVQLMPTSMDGFLSSLLNESLARATIAMRTYTAEYTDRIDPLMNYAIFTAALLRQVSKMVTLYRIVLCKEKGDYIDDWYPFDGSINRHAEFYKIYPLAPLYQRLDVSITPMLARQLMPKQGFDWLTADLLVFADWLDALQGQGGFGGIICHVLDLILRDDLLNLFETLPQAELDLLLSEETQYGEAFYEWLKAGIESGDIKVNSAESGVHVVMEGVFLESAKVFQQFAALSNLPVNDKVVFYQFGNLMGIASKGGNDYFHTQYFSKIEAQSGQAGGFSGTMSQRQGSMVQGMVVADKARIFTGTNTSDVSTSLQSKQVRIASSHQIPTQVAQANLSNKSKS